MDIVPLLWSSGSEYIRMLECSGNVPLLQHALAVQQQYFGCLVTQRVTQLTWSMLYSCSWYDTEANVAWPTFGERPTFDQLKKHAKGEWDVHAGVGGWVGALMTCDSPAAR